MAELHYWNARARLNLQVAILSKEKEGTHSIFLIVPRVVVQIARTANIMQKSVAHEDLRIRRGVWGLRVRKVSRQDRQGLLIDVAFVDDSDTGRRCEPPTYS